MGNDELNRRCAKVVLTLADRCNNHWNHPLDEDKLPITVEVMHFHDSYDWAFSLVDKVLEKCDPDGFILATDPAGTNVEFVMGQTPIHQKLTHVKVNPRQISEAALSVLEGCNDKQSTA